jgi:hypothetical protein
LFIGAVFNSVFEEGTMTTNIFRLCLFLAIFPAIGIAQGMAQVAPASQPEYTITLPDGWVEMPKEVITARLQEIKQAGMGAATLQNYDRGFQQKGSDWFEYPYILVIVNKKGKAPSADLDKLDQIDISGAKDKVVKDFNGLILNAEFGKMQYEKESNVIWLKTRMETSGAGTIEGISGMLLTNEGFIQITGYAASEGIAELIPVVQKMVRTTTVSEKLKYTENHLVGVPRFLRGMNWESVLVAGIRGAVIGVVVALVLGLVRKFKKTS